VRTGGKVALGSAAFAAAIGLIYWFVAYEPAGAALLAGFAAAMLLIAAYVALRLRAAAPDPQDRAEAGPEEASGEEVGAFPSESLWPLVLAFGSMLLVGGLVYGVWLALVGAVVTAWSLVRLIAE
jgi:Cytochrome c oxidase subunit IV